MLLSAADRLVTVQCIGEAFGVDPSDEEQVAQLSCKPTSLKTIFDVFLKTREKTKQGSPSTTGGFAGASSSAGSSKAKAPSAEDKAEAEKLKAKGNQLMTSKKYDEAIRMYDEAIALDATNPVYFSNRAAAHASKGDHLSAIGDAEEAIALDPNFVKAYSRLGCVSSASLSYLSALQAHKLCVENLPYPSNILSYPIPTIHVLTHVSQARAILSRRL